MIKDGTLRSVSRRGETEQQEVQAELGTKAEGAEYTPQCADMQMHKMIRNEKSHTSALTAT